jgi:TolB protein
MARIYPSISLLLFVLIVASQSHAQDDLSLLKGNYTIAYGSSETDIIEIFSLDKDGNSNVESTHAKGGYLAYSPSGNKFAFYAKYDDRKTWSIHTMNIDGSDRKRLTHAKNKWDSAPTWSPDGKKIAFAREYIDSKGVSQPEIWVMNSDGSEQAQIKSLKGSAPFFTPEGRIVFSAEFSEKNSEISIADADGSNLIHLTNNEAKEWHPDVSPDGKHIAFMSDRDGNYEIFVMNIDGSNQKRLTNNDVDDWYPSWSHDGTKIIFASYKDYDKDRHIFIMNKDGSEARKIISNTGYAIFKR